MLIALGVVTAVIAGASFPLTTILFGELVDTFAQWQHQLTLNTTGYPLVTPDQLVSRVSQTSLYFVYLSIGTFVTTFVFMFCFIWTGERQCFRIRETYLAAVLHQDIAWFDQTGAGAVATRISSDMLLIQDAISEKVPLAVRDIATFLSGFTIAFVRGWRLTLVLLGAVPLIILFVAFMNIATGRFQTRILAYYSAAGTIAEEAFAAVRTVMSFNAQRKMSLRYGANLVNARKEGIKKSVASGIGLGGMFFVVYLMYALAFYYGYLLLTWRLTTPGLIVNVSIVLLHLQAHIARHAALSACCV